MKYAVIDAIVEGRDGPIAVRDYRPESWAEHTAFLWVHGGGFTSGGLDQKESDAPARELAARGRWVRTIDYRLAPKLLPWGKIDFSADPKRFPAAHHDVLDVLADLHDTSAASISLGGASAGANLAAGAALVLRDEGSSVLQSLVLCYGTFHADLPDRPSVVADLRGPLAKWAFNPKMTRRMNLNYVGNEDLLVSGTAFPGGADLHGLPATLVLNSRNDRLRQSGDTFADELRAAGVEVEQGVLDSTHAYLNAPTSDAYREGIQQIAHWLDTHEGTR